MRETRSLVEQRLRPERVFAQWVWYGAGTLPPSPECRCHWGNSESRWGIVADKLDRFSFTSPLVSNLNHQNQQKQDNHLKSQALNATALSSCRASVQLGFDQLLHPKIQGKNRAFDVLGA
jgi:hypothetical protein